MRAWRTFLVAHSRVTRQLGIELESEQQLPLASYDVLVQLAEAPGRALRMSELADSVLLSRSGVTRLVDRLERERLVQRRAVASDARGTLRSSPTRGTPGCHERGPPTCAACASTSSTASPTTS